MTPTSPRPLDAPRILVVPIAFNEAHCIGKVLDRLRLVPDIDTAVMNDGSTDGTDAVIRGRGATLISHPRRRGAGAAIRTAYAWARDRHYDIAVIMAGNDKDRPAELPRLLEPIVSGRADLVQGSRYLDGGVSRGLPWHRCIATRTLHPLLFRVVSGRRMTDTTNGFRAVRLSMLDDPRLNLNQAWLDAYELEPYLLLRAFELGYAVCEAPVSKIYPEAGQPYTKMRHVGDWWSILRPLFRASRVSPRV